MARALGSNASAFRDTHGRFRLRIALASLVGMAYLGQCNRQQLLVEKHHGGNQKTLHCDLIVV